MVQADEELVEMSNGCICCTMRGDLLREVTRLARAGAFDYLLIESTGVSEPMQVRLHPSSERSCCRHNLVVATAHCAGVGRAGIVGQLISGVVPARS